MRIALTEFVTLDGVSQGPGSPTEDTSDGFSLGGWLVPHIDASFVGRVSDWLDLADGLLLGRRTYEAFARDWPQITDPDDPFTERMNSLPKYVVSNTLAGGTWKPTTVLRGDPADTVAALKSQPGRELQIHGSATLGNALVSAGLVDTVRLVVAPTVIGSGRRLLAHPTGPVGLRLVRHDVTPTGLLLLEYETTGTAAVGTYTGISAVRKPGPGRDDQPSPHRLHASDDSGEAVRYDRAMAERIAATRRVAAPAGHIFRLITDPAVHVRIDGSGMLVAAGTHDVLRAVGDAFEMEMDREPIGDLPLGRYRVRNTVTRIEPDALLEWSVAANGRSPWGHVWGYTLTPVGENETDVTSYCDWSGVPERRRSASRWPVVPFESIVASLARLDAVATT